MATIIEMPKLSDTMTVGTLVTWLKKEGDKVSPGDALAEVETDKATMELENFEDGYLLRQFVKAGDAVPIGTPICAIGAQGETVEPPKPVAQPAAAPVSATAPAASAQRATPSPSAPSITTVAPHEPTAPPVERPAPHPEPAVMAVDGRVKASPLARRLAQLHGIDLTTMVGSGPGGRIVKADVLGVASAPRAAAAAAVAAVTAAAATAARTPHGSAPTVVSLPFGTPIQDDESVPVTSMRATVARRLLESKTQIPHFYLEIEIDAGPLVDLRKQLNTALGEAGRVSVNDLILKACAIALRKVPAVNCSWEGSSIRKHSAAHIAFAVAIDDGLVTPVVRDCHLKSLVQISAEARALATRARDRKLKPDELTGSTFTVSNLGMYGIERFFAIINPPNAAILACGAVVTKPVVRDEEVIVPGRRMALSLSGDHRVVDGAVGAQFLGALREALEKPLLLLA